jgi:hypothetical protein
MISNETLLHVNPQTGKPQTINLGWLDDAMHANGPTEEDRNFIADTGASPQEMKELVAAYQASMLALKKAVIPAGGFWWQLMDKAGRGSGDAKLAMNTKITPAQCVQILSSYCVPEPPAWNNYMNNLIGRGGEGLTPANLTDYTAEFLLTRGPFAMLGYTWYGCTGSAAAGGGASPDPPRAKEWDMDFGTPAKPCAKAEDGNTFSREYSNATVTWDCDSGHGSIHMK